LLLIEAEALLSSFYWLLSSISIYQASIGDG
jgi:hypothetical protein